MNKVCQDALITACVNGDINTINSLLQDGVNPTFDDNYMFRVACMRNQLTIVNRLLEDPRINPAAMNNAAISVASAWGNLEIIERLLQDPRVDPTVEKYHNGTFSSVLMLAIVNRRVNIIKRLLQDARMNHTIHDNIYLRAARAHGYPEIIELFS